MKHAGCPLDYGWIAVLDGPTVGVCDVWEKLRGPYPRILYSSTGTSQRAIGMYYSIWLVITLFICL